MIAACLLVPAVHALLHDGPLAIVGDNEAVQVKVEAILHCRAVDLRNQAACLGESRSVDADAVADGKQLLRRFSRMLAASSADVNPQFVAERSQSPLKSADDTCVMPEECQSMPITAPKD